MLFTILVVFCINSIHAKNTNSLEPYLLYTTDKSIMRLDIDGKVHQVPTATGLEGESFIDLDVVNEKLYYSQSTDRVGRISLNLEKSAALNASSQSELIVKDEWNLKNLAVDWVGRKLYYLHQYYRGIRVSELNGNSPKTLLYNQLYKATAIALHPQKGFVFFADGLQNAIWRHPAYIGRVGMDGSDFRRLKESYSIHSPASITVDYNSGRFYWADDVLHKIQLRKFSYFDEAMNWVDQYFVKSCDLDGQLCRFVPVKYISEIKALSVLDEYLYWYDTKVAAFYKANKVHGGNQSLLAKTKFDVYDLKIVHFTRQTQSSNPCGTNNGGCSHLCLISPGGESFSCQCPDYFTLQSDRKTCISNCSNSYHLCGNKEDKCIPKRCVCDGIMDCKNGSDEPASCVKPISLQCSYDEHQCIVDNCDYERCPKTVCMSKYSLCNADSECQDGSDESKSACELSQNYLKTPISNQTCTPDQYKCKNGKCIAQNVVCNLVEDCDNGEDEDVAICKGNATCPSGTERCPDNNKCVAPELLCSSICNVDPSSYPKSTKCGKDECDSFSEFQCKTSKTCIAKRRLCDGNDDCGDKSDETDPSCI